MAFPITEDLNGQNKVLKVPVVSFSVKFINKEGQLLSNYKFMTVYRGKQSAMKETNTQGIVHIKALAGQKLTFIDGKNDNKGTKIVTNGSKQWVIVIDKNISTEDIDRVSDTLGDSNSEETKPAETPIEVAAEEKQTAQLKIEKPKVTETEVVTEDGPDLKVESDETQITIKFLDEETGKPLSGLSYITQSDKYGKNTSVTGSDGTRGRTHDSLVGIDITVLVYEGGKEVRKGSFTTSHNRDNPYIYKAKKPTTMWFDPLDSCVVRTARLSSRKAATYGLVRGGGTRNHQGVDFRAIPGKSIRAVADGKVTVIDESYSSKSNFGAYLVLECELNVLPEPQRSHAKKNVKGNKVWFFYAHLSQINTQYRNKEVSAGTVLGKTGASGNARGMTTIASGAHLHFEVRHVSTGSPGRGLVGRFDPLPFFPKLPPA